MPPSHRTGRRLLVTGGSGFLGARVMRRAVADGWSVAGTSFSHGGLRMDLGDHESIRSVIATSAPDAVIHTAYTRDPETMERVIVSGSALLAGELAARGVRMVHVSSDAVFSGDAGRAYVESDPVDPITGYGTAKGEAERLVLAAHPGALVVRTSYLLGGAADPGHLEQRALAGSSGLWCDVVRCPLHVDDLAAALLEALGTDLSGALHVAGPEAMSNARLAELVTGRPARQLKAPAGVARDVRLDSARARAVLTTPIRSASEILPVWTSP